MVPVTGAVEHDLRDALLQALLRHQHSHLLGTIALLALERVGRGILLGRIRSDAANRVFLLRSSMI
jgi:hypothetical protein